PHCDLTHFLSQAPPPPQTYTLSLHDALPISSQSRAPGANTLASAPSMSSFRRSHRSAPERSMISPTVNAEKIPSPGPSAGSQRKDRKSTRLNSSHVSISYAVFCLKKKNIHKT